MAAEKSSVFGDRLSDRMADFEIRRLQGRFPGLGADERVRKVFYDPQTGEVRIIDTADGTYDPVSYHLGGDIGYDIQAVRESPAKRAERRAPVIGPFYEAGEIWERN